MPISRRTFLRYSGTGVAFTALAGRTSAHVSGEPLPRIGLMLRAMYPEFVTAFVDELARLGHVDGETVIIEKRLAKADLSDVPAQAKDVAAMDLRVIVVGSSTWADAVIAANPQMPIIIVTAAAMVESGYAKSLARPGGNVTGNDELPPGLTAKRMHLLKEAAPKVSRIGLLAAREDAAYAVQLKDAQLAASQLDLAVRPYPAPSPQAIEQALAAMISDGIDGLVNFQSGFSLAHRQFIVDFAKRHRLPAVYQATRFAEAGGLMSWSPDQDEQCRVAARTADKVLRGAKVGDLPIQYPERYFLTINAGAAAAIDLTLPPSLLARADTIIG